MNGRIKVLVSVYNISGYLIAELEELSKCAEIAVLDKAPKLEGRNMSVFLSPKPVAQPKKPGKPKQPKQETAPAAPAEDKAE